MRDASVVTSAENSSRTLVSAVPSQVPRASVARRAGGAFGPGGDVRGRGIGLVVREIDELVFGKARVQRDVHQAREALCGDRRQSGDELRIEHTVAHDSQAARALGDQDAAIGQKRHTPRVRQPFRHDQSKVPMRLNGGLRHDDAFGQRGRGPRNRWWVASPAAATSTSCAGSCASTTTGGCRRLRTLTGRTRTGLRTLRSRSPWLRAPALPLSRSAASTPGSGGLTRRCACGHRCRLARLLSVWQRNRQHKRPAQCTRHDRATHPTGHLDLSWVREYSFNEPGCFAATRRRSGGHGYSTQSELRG